MSEIQKSLKYPRGGGVEAYLGIFPKFFRFFLLMAPLKHCLRDCDVLMGDLNLDPTREEDSQKLKRLRERRTSVLNEVTTIRFNQLDHIDLDLNKFNTFYSTSFINYTSDHHLLSLRIAKDGNSFNESHLKKMSFNVIRN